LKEEEQPKEKKDFLDIFALIKNEKINWEKYKELIEKYELKEINQKLKGIISSAKPILQLNLLNHQIARLKKKILEKLK
jgi:hypothetical protein